MVNADSIYKMGIEILFPEGEPNRVSKCFLALQVNTIGDLCQYTRNKLLAVKNVGESTVNQIEKAMHCYGVALKPCEMDEERRAIWEVEVGNSDKRRYSTDTSFEFGANVVA